MATAGARPTEPSVGNPHAGHYGEKIRSVLLTRRGSGKRRKVAKMKEGCGNLVLNEAFESLWSLRVR